MWSYNQGMREFSTKAQLKWIGAGYAFVITGSSVLLYNRYSWEQTHAAEVIASSGDIASTSSCFSSSTTGFDSPKSVN